MSGTHRVELVWRDGRAEAVAVSPDETVLDAAEAAELGLPFGCLTGACATCIGRLLDGALEHRRPPRALKERYLADEYVLLCIAQPRTDCRIEVGSAVHSDIVSNPWK
ncbi:2Fe-2S iron-sulfur cluster-binding protein [Halegenticoccus tardaugens]|uniref:2Fe-2S iron-sulfur cluster-binding protein n=1 Tax=Halegenticoccus tardaugens TaxID=2071624 RepID=UPI00100BAF90|nr:2Fe-2S iron-sulfur cluster-binding protein [Halegenticoccus tardaugens]